MAERQLVDTTAYIGTSQFPQATDPKNFNRWNAGAASDWSSGFFPGWIWYTYEQTLNASWMTRAQAQTASLKSEATDASGHDVGFRIMSSYGNGYRITRDPSYMSVIQTAAQTLASLYRPGAGVIESWPYYDSKTTVIIDNMMNLELLFFAAQNGGDPNWYNMAVSHALKTIQNHVRADGGTYQVVDYNSDGTVYSKFTVEGAGAETTWSRGQAWGLYGFTMTYRYTRDPRFLGTAQQLANYFVNHLPPDFVPYWDFSKTAPEPRDSSAAAIAAAGLLELSTYVAEPNKTTYHNAALNIQASLSANNLGNSSTTDGILLHGSANVPQNLEVDRSLIYGDYYFIQGCHLAMNTPAAPANLTATAVSPAQINLNWDSQAAVRYSVKRSTMPGGPYTTIAPPPVLTANTFTDTSVAASSTYYYVVSAINVAGESPNSTEGSATTPAPPPDTVPPSVSITSPANGATVSGTVTVSGSATDNVGVAGFQFKLDGANLGNEITAPPYSVSWDTTTIVPGSHTLTALARDAAGNTATSSAVTAIVSTAYNPVADAYVRGGNFAAQNYGSAVTLQVKDAKKAQDDYRTFLRFDLNSAAGTVSKAVLRLYAGALPDGTPAPVTLFAVSSDAWAETSITWNNQPAVGASLLTQKVTAPGWIALDVTTWVQQKLQGSKLVSLMLQDNTQASKMVQFNSRENVANRPILEITR